MSNKPTVFAWAKKRRGRLYFENRAGFDMDVAARLPEDVPLEVVVRVPDEKRKRSLAQNRRYWALLTVAAESLWDEPESAEELHEEIAHLLLPLPPCPKTGLRRRMRTPKLKTDEFAKYMDRVVDKLIQLGADLSGWDAEVEKQTRAA